MLKITGEMLARLRHQGTTARTHGYASRAFHWLGGALLAFALIENGERTRVLFNPAAMRRDVILGVIVAVVFLVRPTWVYFFRGGSRLPADTPRWERWLAWASHFAIYATLAAVLASGFLIAYLRPGVQIFRVRRRLRIGDAFLAGTVGFHVGVSNFLIFLIYLHIANAFWHWLFREDGVWESMTGKSLNAIKDSLKAWLVAVVNRDKGVPPATSGAYGSSRES
jgi:cytochrome b561